MKLLMMAYACEPAAGGEPSVGWHWAVTAAAAGHEVCVITRGNNRQAIEAGLIGLDHIIRGSLAFEYVDLPRWIQRLKKRLGPPGLLLYYYLFQLRAIRTVRKLETKQSPDFCHHVTFCNDSIFSALAFSRSPLIWGPVGGRTHRLPKWYLDQLSPSARSYELIRSIMQSLLRGADPLFRRTRKRAAVCWFYSHEAITSTPAGAKIIVAPHVGVAQSSVVAAPKARTPDEPLVFTTVGRLVHWKGFDLCLRALAVARVSSGLPLMLDVVGDGAERPRLERLARELDIDQVVRFLGRVPAHADVVRIVASSIGFVQPTLRDGPPVAIIEAMSLGVPVLTAAFGANAEVVPVEGGWVVDATNLPDLVEGLAAAMIEIASAPTEARRRALLALQHVSATRTWEAIGKRQRELYAELQAEL